MSFKFGTKRVELPPISQEERERLIAKAKVRRFPMGSSDAMIQEALEAMGMKVLPNPAKRNRPWRLWSKGAKKPRLVTNDELMEVVDGWRKRHGKPPLQVKR